MKKLSLKNQKQIDKVIRKVIKDYGCVLEAIEWNNEEIIKDCERSGHRRYHNSKIAYNLELNI